MTHCHGKGHMVWPHSSQWIQASAPIMYTGGRQLKNPRQRPRDRRLGNGLVPTGMWVISLTFAPVHINVLIVWLTYCTKPCYLLCTWPIILSLIMCQSNYRYPPDEAALVHKTSWDVIRDQPSHCDLPRLGSIILVIHMDCHQSF